MNKSSWTKQEKSILNKLDSPEKINKYLAKLKYKVKDGCYSPSLVMKYQTAHCFDGALMGAAALEFHGHRPLIVDLWAEDDDEHVICVYQVRNLWGSIAKSNTSLLLERAPVYKSIRELVMSYFDCYFNYRGKLGLYSYSKPINLNQFNRFNWRHTEENLDLLTEHINNARHYQILSPKKLRQLPKVNSIIKEACFFKSNLAGVRMK